MPWRVVVVLQLSVFGQSTVLCHLFYLLFNSADFDIFGFWISQPDFQSNRLKDRWENRKKRVLKMLVRRNKEIVRAGSVRLLRKMMFDMKCRLSITTDGSEIPAVDQQVAFVILQKDTWFSHKAHNLLEIDLVIHYTHIRGPGGVAMPPPLTHTLK